MYFSSVGGNFMKAQTQNHYENVRCDLYKRDISKRHIHSLTNINKSIREAKETLRDIRASSGYCREVWGNESATNVWKEPEWSRRTSRRNDGNLGKSEIQAIRKMSIENSGEQSTVSKMTVDGFNPTSSFPEKNDLNIVENSLHGKNGAEVNGDRSDIVPDGRLLRDEILMRPESRNVSDRVIRGTSRHGMESTDSAKKSGVIDPQGKSQIKSTSNGGNFQITDTSSTDSGKRLGTLSTNVPPESVIDSSKRGKSRPNTSADGLVGYRSQTAPEKASRIKSPAKSARTSKSDLKENPGSRYLSTSEVKKVKIHVSISRTERKRLLQELISSCTVPCDRSALERLRQRRLQEKIDRYFELLFEQDNTCDKGRRE